MFVERKKTLHKMVQSWHIAIGHLPQEQGHIAHLSVELQTAFTTILCFLVKICLSPRGFITPLKACRKKEHTVEI